MRKQELKDYVNNTIKEEMEISLKPEMHNVHLKIKILNKKLDAFWSYYQSILKEIKS
jgi:hypothetical protein